MDCRSGLAEWCSRKSTMERWPCPAASVSAAAAACSRDQVFRPSSFGTEWSALTVPPWPSHLTTFCSSPRPAAWKISLGSEAGELAPASGGVAGGAMAGCGSATCRQVRDVLDVWLLTSAHCISVRLFSSSSDSVLVVASSRACMHPNIMFRRGGALSFCKYRLAATGWCPLFY
eukprot:scaffold74319_cov72-Phaeocystis_antarctica.AAC.3